MNPSAFGRRGSDDSVRGSPKEKDELDSETARYPAHFVGPCAISALAIALVDKPTSGAVGHDRVKPRFNGDFSGILDGSRTWYGNSVTCPIQAQNSIGDRLLAKTIQKRERRDCIVIVRRTSRAICCPGKTIRINGSGRVQEFMPKVARAGSADAGTYGEGIEEGWASRGDALGTNFGWWPDPKAAITAR